MQEINKCVEQIRLRDGREAEERVVEKLGDDGCIVERVTEVHAEPVRPKLLEQRIVEKVRPIVYEREIDTIKDGQVVEKKVESLDPEVKMELRQHLGLANVPEAPKPAALTKDDLRDLLAELRQPQPAIRAQGLQDEVAKRVKELGNDKVWVLGGLAIIAIQVAALAYLLFIY
jgi:hypothetical protein